MRGGAGKMLNFAFNTIQRDSSRMMGPDVTPSQREAFQAEFTRFRKNISDGRAPMTEVQKVLNEMRDAVGDRKLTPDEVDGLTELMKGINERAEKNSTSKPVQL